MDKRIRPIYTELQGYLSQSPEKGVISEEIIWKQVNETIEMLEEITNENYSKFKLTTTNYHMQGEGVSALVYKTSLAGLIHYLFGKYFKHDISPLVETPNMKTHIEIKQEQNQFVMVKMMLDIRNKIDEKLKVEMGETERSFLKKIKESCSSVNNIMELLNSILLTGMSLGLTLNQVFELLK